MLKVMPVKIAEIYITAARRAEFDQSIVDAIIEDLLEGNPQKPIKVRRGKGRFVLLASVNRVEAGKAVGEEEIGAYIVQAQKF